MYYDSLIVASFEIVCDNECLCIAACYKSVVLKIDFLLIITEIVH